MIVALAFFVVGFAHGWLVTGNLTHSSSRWSRPIRGTHWRYANLPVGGVVVLVASLALHAPALLALSAAYTLAAAGWRLVCPA